MTDLPLTRQPVFEMAFQEHQSRLTTFFRLVTAIPSMLLLALWSLALWVTLPIAWFALLFTGRYPGGLYDFHAAFARYATYAYGYLSLATDRWPGFSGSPDVDYPLHLRLGAPLPVYDRIKVLFRIIIGIPVYLIATAMNVVAQIGAFIAWFAIVFTGRLPEGIFQMLRLGLSYQHRALPYGLLLTEDWPVFVQEEDRRALQSPPATDAGSGTLTPLSAPAPGPVPSAPADAPPPDLGEFAPPEPPAPQPGDPGH